MEGGEGGTDAVWSVLVSEVPADDGETAATGHVEIFSSQEATDVRLTHACNVHAHTYVITDRLTRQHGNSALQY